MSSRAMALDEYLGHTARGGGNTFLRGWKKRTPPAVDTVIHTRAPFVALWQHNLPRIQVIEKEGEPPRREVWGGTWACIEPESVLKGQYKRDRDSGERRVPPTICPACILIEHVRRQVAAGQIKFTQPLFKWEGDEADKARVITAAGIFNGYNDKDKLTREQKVQMRKAGISPKESWKENAYAKCNYLFVVVDVDNVDDGVQVAIETTLLGDKIKEAIRDRMVAMGEDEGNPMKNPYAIRWEHHPDKQVFNEKYKAIVMPKIAITEAIRQLIEVQDPPDVSGIAAPGNVKQLRADLESHALVEFPWDEIFGPSEAYIDDDDDDRPAAAPPPESSKQQAVGSGDGDEEVFSCDKCGKPGLTAFDTECEHCGAKYDPDTGDLLPDEPKPEKRSEASKPKKRSEAKKPGAAAAQEAAKLAQQADHPNDEAGDEDDPFDGDQIPF